MPEVKKLVELFTSLTQGLALKPGQYKITAKTWDVRACVCIPGVTFAFDKSFLRPSVVDALKDLQKAFDDHPDAMVFVFGHTDKVGSEQYNKDLSDRRAKSAYAFVTNDVAAWEALYNEESWGLISVQEILTDMGFYKGPVDGKDTPASKQAIKDYQISKGQTDTGSNDKPTRELLFLDYMTGKHDVKIAKERFLEPKFTGCGEFNPKIETEKEEEKNRRVSFFLFDPGKVPKIPCKVGDTAPCKKMIALPGPRKKKEFKCAFFDNISSDCACESAPPKPATFSVTGTIVFYNRTWDYNTAPANTAPPKPIPAVKEALPGAGVELYLEHKLSKGSFVLHDRAFLTDDGAFEFKGINEVTKARLRILLEHKDGKIVVVKGMDTLPKEKDFEVKLNSVVWHELDLDTSKWDGKTLVVDSGETEVKHAHFRNICDAYKTVWFGHKQVLDMTGVDLPLCQVNYPEPGTSNASVQMQLNTDDTRDRDVILHEYGHFTQQHALGGVTNAGYDYNKDDAQPSHGLTSKEHYESAWCEGFGTFISCALSDDPIYHDGYDTDMTFHLHKDNTLIGPHCEGSIQEALWKINKSVGVKFKDGIWKCFSRPGRAPQTVFDFFNNWKELGIPDLDKVIAAFKHFKMEFGYEYKLKFKCVAAPGAFDAAKQEFRTIQELFDNFGTLGGGGISDYREEFFNRNRSFNNGSLGAGSDIQTPKVTVGKTYIVPVRFQIKA
jgi:hypothetical protein